MMRPFARLWRIKESGKPRVTRFVSVPLLLALATVSVPVLARADEGADFFERKIRPVLVENCISCHGPKAQKAGLRLDSRAAVLEGGENGPALVVGDPESSLLISAIGYQADPKMPPRAQLPVAAIGDLRAWVRMGVPWPESVVSEQKEDHAQLWSLKPVTHPDPPKVSLEDWPKTSIDRFILASLEERGLRPAPPADRRTMIRRWSYTLIGLPPSPEEVGAYLADESSEADRKVVDRLLASPHYGERWARHWLDVARYADTKGYVFFEDAAFPWAYAYRDYVIRAFNNDLPYYRFVLEQLAADQLPLGDDKRPLTALGFLTVGGRFMNNVQDIMDDRIDVTTRGLLGLTVTCARCHDHKFDPIPTADYYSLYGVFSSSIEPGIPPLFEPPPYTDEYQKFDSELRTREAKLEAFLTEKYESLMASTRHQAAEYLLAGEAARNTPKTDQFMLIADTNDLNPAMIARWRAWLDRTRRVHDPVFAIWHTLADLGPEDFPTRARKTLADMIASGRPLNPLIVETLTTNPPSKLEDVATCYGNWLSRADLIVHEFSERASLNRTPNATFPFAGFEEIARAVDGPDSPCRLRKSEIDNLSLVPDRASQATLIALTKAVESWRATGTGAPPRAMTLVDLPEPVEPRVYLRGNPNTPGPAVSRRFLSAFGSAPPFQKGSGRLELAQAIVDPKNPLTARVFVNRVWMEHFGTPLVATPSDFGSRSDPPTNPALLDHLASTFINEGWSIKALHRRIVLSATFRQSSDDQPQARRIDPENRLYGRMNRRRLDWESTRDTLLATSGQLDQTVGGPSVGDMLKGKSRRRTLYGSIDRLNLPGIYRTFDFPDPNFSAPQRVETSVPPQALFFMNHPFLRDSALALWKRDDVQKQTTVDRIIARVYEILFNRHPEPREIELHRQALGGPQPTESDWLTWTHSLLLTNEFTFVD